MVCPNLLDYISSPEKKEFHIRVITVGVFIALLGNVASFWAFFENDDTTYATKTNTSQGHFCIYANTSFELAHGMGDALKIAQDGIFQNNSMWQKSFDMPRDDKTLMRWIYAGTIMAGIGLLGSVAAMIFHGKLVKAWHGIVIFCCQLVCIVVIFVGIAFGYMVVITSFCVNVKNGGVDASGVTKWEDVSIVTWSDWEASHFINIITLPAIYLGLIVMLALSEKGDWMGKSGMAFSRLPVWIALAFQTGLAYNFYEDLTAENHAPGCKEDAKSAEAGAHLVLLCALASGLVWFLMITFRVIVTFSSSKGDESTCAYLTEGSKQPWVGGSWWEMIFMMARIVLFPFALVYLYVNRLKWPACPGVVYAPISNANFTNSDQYWAQYDETDHVTSVAKCIFYIVLLDFLLLASMTMFAVAKGKEAFLKGSAAPLNIDG